VNRNRFSIMARFEIHDRLRIDAHTLGRFQLCHLLLHKNAVLPWFILVPETDAADLLDLPEDLRNSAVNEAAIVSDFIKERLGIVRQTLPVSAMWCPSSTCTSSVGDPTIPAGPRRCGAICIRCGNTRLQSCVVLRTCSVAIRHLRLPYDNNKRGNRNSVRSLQRPNSAAKPERP
jgi:hypothetical protein